MSFSWLPSGCSRAFFNFNFWSKPKVQHRQWENLEFKCTTTSIPHPNPNRKPLQSDKLELPHMEAIFDNGATRTELDRSSEGYKKSSIGPFEIGSRLNPHLDWVMASAHYLHPSDGNYAKACGLRMLADSGGAQIKLRTATYVDPEHVIESFNACADYGMALDIAPRPDIDNSNKSVLTILARLQKKNNELFAARRRPDLGLLNVAHGTMPDDFRLWIDIVKDPVNFQGWAIGRDAEISNVLMGAAILYREYGLKDANQWLHLFGVSGPVQIPAMAWLGKYIPLLTSDSSSYLEGCRRRTYFLNNGGKIQSIPLGTGIHCNFENSGYSRESMLPCSCEFCSEMKYFGAFASPGFDSSFPMIIAHNLVVIKQVAAQWNTLAQKMELSDYVKLVKSKMGAKSANLIQYLDCCINDGPEYANKQFNQFINGGGGMYRANIEERTSRQITRTPLFAVGKTAGEGSKRAKEEGLICGLANPGSNIEVIGNYMTDAELLATYKEFGFSAAEQSLITKMKQEKVEISEQTDKSLPSFSEDGEVVVNAIGDEENA